MLARDWSDLVLIFCSTGILNKGVAWLSSHASEALSKRSAWISFKGTFGKLNNEGNGILFSTLLGYNEENEKEKKKKLLFYIQNLVIFIIFFIPRCKTTSDHQP